MLFQNDYGKLDRESYSILVLWLSGMQTDLIASVAEVTSGKVRGITRSREAGGRMPKPRDEMSKEERQALLDDLKGFRLDGDFLKPFCFTAHDLKPSQSTRQGRKEATSFRKACGMLLADLEDRKRRRSEGGAERRGDRAHAMLFLERSKLLDDPVDKQDNSRERTSPIMRRRLVGEWLRKLLEDAQLSGFKEVNMEVSSGGLGMPIVERFVAAQAELRGLQAIIPEELYTAVLVPVVFDDAFVWEVPSRESRRIILEDLRRGLDLASLYHGTLSRESYRIRWDEEAPIIEKRKTRDEARETVRAARELIQEGQRA